MTTSYRDILKTIYIHNPQFKEYVDRWCDLTGHGLPSAFENADIQRMGVRILNRDKDSHIYSSL